MKDVRHYFQQLEEPHVRGDAAEAIVRAQFAVRGIDVLLPQHDNAPYDIVVDIDDELYRIHIKTAYSGTNEGAVRFET
ncbi:group I intron-associated PD-(D/E)XK endonuclease [Haladaptatus sp. CMAA 1911]|uniref:group I intron-associated PD-(D/E)XK endonuclease n=1 Tax=unclassified Haladaptatus TaxID=2622732 RepID=UPI0037552829